MSKIGWIVLGGCGAMILLFGVLFAGCGMLGFMIQDSAERQLKVDGRNSEIASRQAAGDRPPDWSETVDELARDRPPLPKRESPFDLIRYLETLETFANERLHTDNMKRLGFRGENGDLSMLRNGFLQMYWDRLAWREISKADREEILMGIWREWSVLVEERTKLPVVEVVPGPSNTNSVLGKVNAFGEVAVYD